MPLSCRQRPARLRRQIAANRAALGPIAGRLPELCSAELRQALRAAVERFDGLAQDLELVQERARLLQEEIAGRVGEATNRNLFLSTIPTSSAT